MFICIDVEGFSYPQSDADKKPIFVCKVYFGSFFLSVFTLISGAHHRWSTSVSRFFTQCSFSWVNVMFVLFTLTVLYLKCFLSLIIEYFMYSWMQTNVNKKPLSLFGNVIQIKEWYNCLSLYITVCLKRNFVQLRVQVIWTEFHDKSLNLLLIYFPFLKFPGFFDKVVQLWPSLSSKF